MLVPPMYAYAALAGFSAQNCSCGASDERVDKMKVPGATTSGFMRICSSHGPRPLKPASASGSPDSVCPAIGSAGKAFGHQAPKVGSPATPVRSLRLAPTVSAFFAVPGALTDTRSTKPGWAVTGFAAVALLPAAITISMSGCSHTKLSTSSELTRYEPRASAPQLLLWIRAPSA